MSKRGGDVEKRKEKQAEKEKILDTLGALQMLLTETSIPPRFSAHREDTVEALKCQKN